MSVFVMLAFCWWGLIGFLCVIGVILLFLEGIGSTGRMVFFILLTLLGIHLVNRHEHAEERAAEGFLAGWQAESDNFPEGVMNTRTWGEFASFDRLGDIDSRNMAERERMLLHEPVRSAGREIIHGVNKPEPVKTKVFLSPIYIYYVACDVYFRGNMRIWVAEDTNKVVKFVYEKIVFSE